MLQDLQNLYGETQEKIKNLEETILQMNLGITQVFYYLMQTLDFDSLFQCFSQNSAEESEQEDLSQQDSIDYVENSLFQCILTYREQYCKHYGKFKLSLEKTVRQDVQAYTNQYLNLMKLSKSGKDDVELNFGQIEKSLTRWQSSKLIDFYYLYFLVCKIEQKLKREINQVNRLHLGSEHGFNLAALLTKIEGKKHLCMIFKSRVGEIFGAFTLCDWQKDNNWNQQFIHTKDNEHLSFLFSYTRDETYSFKKDQNLYACYISKQYGIMFGGTIIDNKFKYSDLVIKPDFKDGYSELGFAYNANIDTDEIATYLFGEKEPNIVEFEVFEFI